MPSPSSAPRAPWQWRLFYLAKGEPLQRLVGRFAGGQWLPPADLRARQLSQLKSQLVHAYRRIPFYTARFDEAGFRPERLQDFGDLARIPATTRADLHAYFSRHRPGPLHRLWLSSSRHTSGSSGTALTLRKGYRAQAVMDAVMIRSYAWHGVSLQDTQIRFWGSHLGRRGFRTSLRDRLLNRIRFSPFDISLAQARRLLEAIDASRPCHFYGYAQTTYHVARLLDEAGIRYPGDNIRGIILTAETALPHQRAVIERVFNTRTINEYGCTEAGILALECPRGSLHLMENLWCEFDCSPGMEGGEVIVTELTPDAFPLIRYRLGDIAVPGSGSCPCGRGLALIERLNGRATEVIPCADGRLVDPWFVDYLLAAMPKRYGSVTHFKIRHMRPDSLEILLAPSEHLRADIVQYLAPRVASVLGAGMHCSFSLVSKLSPDLAGKWRCYSKEFGSAAAAAAAPPARHPHPRSTPSGMRS